LEVDWAGDTMTWVDPATGAHRKAFLFVAAMSYSVYTYVGAFGDMTLESWIDAHVAAFEFFGGAARLLVCDNLRAGVSKADRYEPALNPAYQQMADHYGTAVVPARVRRPRDKPAGEGAVRFGANAINAALRNRRFVGLDELGEAVADELARLNAKPFQKRGGSRLEVFERDEKPLLNPLPRFPFELAELKKAKAAPNYHIQVAGCFYSVPYRLVGVTLDVRITSRVVEVFDGTERVACHARWKGVKGAYRTAEDHMPPAHRAYAEGWTAEGLTARAAGIGSATRAVVEAILTKAKIVEQSYRSCLGVLSMARRAGGAARLEQSCQKALDATPAPSYTLVKRLWNNWEPPPAAASLSSEGYVRGAAYYDTNKGEQQ
jgi:transposase